MLETGAKPVLHPDDHDATSKRQGRLISALTTNTTQAVMLRVVERRAGALVRFRGLFVGE